MSRFVDITNIEIPSDENDWDKLVAFADTIAEQETIDIVQCRDCVYQNSPDCQMKASLHNSHGDDFCSYGKRKNCSNCYYGKYNDHWNTKFCYNDSDCLNFKLWKKQVPVEKMRDATKEEVRGVNDYIRGISEKTDVNFFDYVGDVADCAWK